MKKNKKSEEKGKFKIIKEKVNQPFKEIKKQGKKDSEESEEELSDFISQSTETGFSSETDFSPLIHPSNPVQPTQSTPEEQEESLEHQLGNVPEGENPEQETKLYNAPDYSGNYENVDYESMGSETGNEETFGRMESSQGLSTDNNFRTIDQSQWFSQAEQQEIGQIKQQEREEDYVHVARADQDEGLPFEQSKRRRRRL